MISHNKQKTCKFSEISELLEFEDVISLQSEGKSSNGSDNSNSDESLLFTFLGGIYNTFKEDKIIEEDLTTKSTIGYSQDAVESIIGFFPHINRFISECGSKSQVNI